MSSIIRDVALRRLEGTWDVKLEGEGTAAVERSIEADGADECDGRGAHRFLPGPRPPDPGRRAHARRRHRRSHVALAEVPRDPRRGALPRAGLGEPPRRARRLRPHPRREGDGAGQGADITICSKTQISPVMGGRNDRGLVRRGTTRVKELLANGINVASARDDVNDPHYAFGKPDQLEVGQYTALAQLTYPTELETVFDMLTTNPARALRLPDYGVEPGDRAVLIEAPNAHAALRLLAPRRAVFYGGRLVAESSLSTRRHPQEAGA